MSQRKNQLRRRQARRLLRYERQEGISHKLMTSNIFNGQLKEGDRINITPKLSSDSIELMEVYIAYMRAHEDFDTVPEVMNRFNDQIFTGKDTSLDQLRQLAVYTVDKIYRIAAELEVRDEYTVTYFKKVVARFMQSLQDKGIEIFYILDNKIREDRFKLTVMLYELSGATVVTPYISDKTLSFEDVEERFKSPMAHGRNIVYIEKDASVNYIEKVMKIAAESRYIGVFRNYAPSNNYIETL
jgi:hypothetical protein